MMRAVATMLAIALAVTGAAPAAANSTMDRVPDGFATWTELLTVQDRLVAVAEKVRAAGGDGFAGFQLRLELRELRVYWKGEAPQGVTDAIRDQAGVRLLPAAFSEKELLALAATVRGPEVVASGPLSDGSGVSVSVTGAAAAETAVATIRAAGARMVVETYTQAPKLFYNRQDDKAPYYGGAMYNHPVGLGTGYCSTGFAVKVGVESKILSAAHCGVNGETLKDGGGQVMGTFEGDNNTNDIILIDAPAAGKVYVGSHTSGVSDKIIGAMASMEGLWICTSGANSGDHCNIKVTKVNQSVPFQTNEGTFTIFPLVRAEEIDHEIAAAPGDSGGPVLTQTQHPDLQRAAGTITGGGGVVEDCGPMQLPTPDCGWYIYYVDIATALTYYGATITTYVPHRK
jgi:hypothetical protein